LSAKKAKEILDWKARYTLEERLRRTMEWYKKFFNEEVNKQ
jgi:CDP-glucose 4,6-dehydratase